MLERDFSRQVQSSVKLECFSPWQGQHLDEILGDGLGAGYCVFKRECGGLHESYLCERMGCAQIMPESVVYWLEQFTDFGLKSCASIFQSLVTWALRSSQHLIIHQFDHIPQPHRITSHDLTTSHIAHAHRITTKSNPMLWHHITSHHMTSHHTTHHMT